MAAVNRSHVRSSATVNSSMKFPTHPLALRVQRGRRLAFARHIYMECDRLAPPDSSPVALRRFCP